MRIAAIGEEAFVTALKKISAPVTWLSIDDLSALTAHQNIDALFCDQLITEKAAIELLNIPVFINCVEEKKEAGSAFIYFNGWPGFIDNDTWEIAGTMNSAAVNILNTLGKKYIVCNDEPGFISGRILAMIINEAYYAKGEGISTEEEIDTAMKLGTNYPYGPFEWAEIIGHQNIVKLLQKLALTDNRYIPSPALLKHQDNF